MKIWQKLAIGFGGTFFLLGTIVVLVAKLDSKVQSASDETIHGMVEEARGAGKIFTSIQTIQKFNQDLLLEKLTNSQTIKINRDEIKLELQKLEKNIIAVQRATIQQKSIIHNSKEITSSRKEIKISDETEEIVRMTQLLGEIQNYQRDWQLFIERKDASNPESSLDSIQKFAIRMNQVIFPLVKEYYEDSLDEIIESELRTQQLTSENSTIITNYVLFVLVLLSILYIYIYRSISTSIKYVKLATFHLGLNGSEYKAISPKNPNDELGELIKVFNHTVEHLKKHTISKSYLDSIINSLDLSLIIVNNENKIERINLNTIETLGYSESELIGKPITEIIVFTNHSEVDKSIGLERLSNNYFTIDFLTKKLEKISCTVCFSDLCDSQGKKQGTICLAMQNKRMVLADIIDLQNTPKKYKDNLN